MPDRPWHHATVPQRAALHIAFACSGGAALIYEIVWTRLLTLYVGHTVAAASTVLAAFMGGLALGAALAGRRTPALSRRAAIRGYALLEILVAAGALALPLEIRMSQPLLALAYADGAGATAFALVRLACALLVVTLPAIAMGATLPLVVRWTATTSRRAGFETGLVYATNTIGAAAGAVAAGFVLLPAFGMRITTWIAVGLNVVSASLGWWLSSGTLTSSDPPVAASHRRVRSRTPTAPRRSGRTVAAWALAISGCVSLLLQVAWTRILAMAIGPTTFAFSAMVATFVAGIAVGSLAGGWLTRRGSTSTLLAVSLFVTAVAAIAAAMAVARVPLLVAAAAAAPDASFRSVVWSQALVVAGLMLPMTVALGAAFPLAVGLAAQDDRTIAADTAVVYAANTIGAITGALAGGFVLVPWLGLETTVRVAATLAIAGFVAVLAASGSRRHTAAGVAVAGVAMTIVWLLPRWDRELLSSGGYKYAPYLSSDVDREALLRAGTLLFYQEGATATVTVRGVTGSLALAIDGKVDASNGGDMLTQRLLAHLPLLLHPAPRRVGIIGLGSGVTLASALRHPIVQADVVEISPEVVRASALFVADNRHALADPRTRLIVGDGRSHLALGRGTYDVLISEPSNPWMAGVAALFTQEFLLAARSRLAPGGLVCQWAHAYDISAADLRSIVATFESVFPETGLWLVGSDVLLIGSIEPLDGRLAQIGEAWSRPGVAQDLAEVGATSPDALLSLFAASGKALRRYSDGAAIQRDDRMALEFSAPREIVGRSSVDNAAELDQLARSDDAPLVVQRARASPEANSARGAMLLQAEAYSAAFDALARACDRNATNAATVDGFVHAAVAADRIDDAIGLLQRLNRQDPENVAVAVAISDLLAGRGDFVAAAEPLRPAFQHPRPDLRAMDQLASVFADAGDLTRLATIVAQLNQVFPDSEPSIYFGAALQFSSGHADEALRIAKRLQPASGRMLNLVGAANGAMGRADEARQAFLQSLQLEPRDPAAYANLGELELDRGNPQLASRYFAQAIILDPASTRAKNGLSQATTRRRE